MWDTEPCTFVMIIVTHVLQTVNRQPIACWQPARIASQKEKEQLLEVARCINPDIWVSNAHDIQSSSGQMHSEHGRSV